MRDPGNEIAAPAVVSFKNTASHLAWSTALSTALKSWRLRVRGRFLISQKYFVWYYRSESKREGNFLGKSSGESENLNFQNANHLTKNYVY